MLAKKRAQGVSIRHPLGQKFPKLIVEERLLDLVQRLRKGDESTHQEIIFGHVRLAISIASKLSCGIPHKADVLISESLFGLVYAVRHAKEKLIDDNITAYISGCCTRRVKNFICRDRTVPVPQNTYWKRKKRGLETGTVSIYELNGHTPVVKGHSDYFDQFELITSVAKDEFDLEIIYYRKQGYNDKEIGVILDCSRACIEKRRRELRIKFEKLEKELE